MERRPRTRAGRPFREDRAAVLIAERIAGMCGTEQVHACFSAAEATPAELACLRVDSRRRRFAGYSSPGSHRRPRDARGRCEYARGAWRSSSLSDELNSPACCQSVGTRWQARTLHTTDTSLPERRLRKHVSMAHPERAVGVSGCGGRAVDTRRGGARRRLTSRAPRTGRGGEAVERRGAERGEANGCSPTVGKSAPK